MDTADLDTTSPPLCCFFLSGHQLCDVGKFLLKYNQKQVESPKHEGIQGADERLLELLAQLAENLLF